ncbi:MAG TPA: hypothetical protein VFM05_10705, partial [Candidatus Saccharimonadales bacterium]|nr:hypothetical protein [Candidatus Saccharimonadales bacterium]
ESPWQLAEMGFSYGKPQFDIRWCKRANTACTRLVGVCAFSGSLCGLKLVPSKWRYLVPPTNPHQSATRRVTRAVGRQIFCITLASKEYKLQDSQTA